jgi:hypothetical protein
MFKGSQNFRQCQVKQVEVRIVGYSDYEAELDCPKTEAITVKSDKKYTKEGAVRDLRGHAGRLMCEHCIYSAMTPLEVEQARISQAQARITRIETEAVAMRVEKEFSEALNMGREEVAEIERRIDGTPDSNL